MRHYAAVVLTLVFWSAFSWPAQVSAQEAGSFEQLQMLVNPGDKVEVIGTDGSSTKGTIESLSASSLRLATKGKTRDYAQRDAVEIKQRRGDSLWNGAWIGAASGAGFGVLGWIIEGGCDCSGGEVVGIVAVFSGIGTGIGLGIDAMFAHRQTIYRTPAQTALSHILVSPLIGSGRKGAVLRFSF